MEDTTTSGTADADSHQKVEVEASGPPVASNGEEGHVAEESTSTTVTKSQMKKMARREKFEQKKLRVKELRRATRRDERKERQIKVNQGLRDLAPLQNQAISDPPVVFFPHFAGLLPPKKRPKRTVAISDKTVVIDMSFEAQMSEKDMGSAFKQVQHSYSCNRRRNLPLRLYVSSLGGKTKELADLWYPNYPRWQMTFEPRHYEEIFEKDQIVYLTAESDNVLDKLESNKVYVVGGIVDHNSQKVGLFFFFFSPTLILP